MEGGRQKGKERGREGRGTCSISCPGGSHWEHQGWGAPSDVVRVCSWVELKNAIQHPVSNLSPLEKGR